MSDFQRAKKNEHVEIAMAQHDATLSDFDKVRFVHHSIPNIDVDDVDLTTKTSEFNMKYQFILMP